MNIQQALTVIKQTLDAAIKAGVCPNLDTSAAIAQAWEVIIKTMPSVENSK